MSSKKYKKKKLCRCALIISGAAIFLIVIGCLISFFWQKKQEDTTRATTLPQITIEKKLLQKNKYSRPGIALKQVKGIVVHYTANPGTDAVENRNYFNNLPTSNQEKKTKTYASSHFVIGLSGNIVQCIPLSEISYASNDRNTDTISIECCHPDSSGKFNEATYQALLELTTYLCVKFNLTEEDVIRHYDVTGKNCPKYFVEHEDKWNDFKEKVKNLLTLK